ncbi:MAG: hypothetical protein IPM35_38010 [Myxococcales bacterium]|nr:hypothetical protein [Myxococcales bacterium]
MKTRGFIALGLLIGACTLGARDDSELSGGSGGNGAADAGADATACTATSKDCDGLAANGCETPIDKDPKNCGACGNACPSDGGKTPTCVDGKCGVSNCAAPLADCDGDGSCETDTSSSVDHCGFCEYKCALPNAKSVCANGCQIEECDSGFESCDGIPSNGCETPLDTDTDCGFCGTACSLPNATSSCTTGTCTITTCSTGYGDCDKLPETGCESNTQTDPNNCGACGTVCSNTQVCQGGKCVVSSCTAPAADCDNNPADCETNTNTSAAHCGFCNNPCTLAHATAACSGGKCTVATCATGWGNCDGNDANGCETQLNTTTNCKSCGDKCSGGLNVLTSSCASSGCSLTCTPGFGNCNASALDGCESQLTNDPTHCGTCTKDCTATAPPGTQAGCSSGACTYNCAIGTADCDGNGSCETNVNTSAANCGQCGHSCGGTACVGGFCTPDVVVPGSDLTSVDADTSTASLAFTRNPGGVFRVQKSTKSVTSITTQHGSTSVDVITTYSFFAAPAAGVFRVLTGGGSLTQLSSVTGANQVDSDGNYVFFTSTSGLRRVSAGGGFAQTWDPSPGVSGLRFDNSPGWVFWTVPSAGEVRYSGVGAPSIQTVATGQGDPSFVKVDSQYVFWTATSDGAVRRATKPASNVTTVASGQQSPYALAQDGTELFWASKGANGGLWRGLKTGTGTPVKLADSLTNVLCIEVDATHVYWIDSGGLKRVPR